MKFSVAYSLLLLAIAFNLVVGQEESDPPSDMPSFMPEAPETTEAPVTTVAPETSDAMATTAFTGAISLAAFLGYAMA